MSDNISEEEKLRLARETQQLLANGWVWQGEGIERQLVLPDDPEVSIWFDPYSGEQLLSPKLVARIQADHERELRESN
jgi:hypothetical protein